MKRSTGSNKPKTRKVSLAPGVEMVFLQISAGKFTMGTTLEKDPQAKSDEMPEHEVFLSEYWIGKYPVTNTQYMAFTRATGYRTLAEKIGRGWIFDGKNWLDAEGVDWLHPDGPDSDIADRMDHPVIQITYDDALAFCRWLSHVENLNIRIPTEAEWEKAARGDKGYKFPWGNAVLDDEHCNFGKQNVGTIIDTTPVDFYSPISDSPYGICDMAGNVFEWTSDWYAEDYYASSPILDPKGPATGENLVLRGGSRYFDDISVRTTNRNKIEPTARDTDIGFRCVFSG